MNTNNTLHTTALEYHDAGLTVIPIRTDGTKKPAVEWKQYQTTPPTREQINAWWTKKPDAGIGMLTGTPSGRIEMIEVEARAVHALPALEEETQKQGISELWHQVTRGWVHSSPYGGLHWHIRLPEDAGPMPHSTVIARKRTGKRNPKTEKHDWETYAETRGEGGYTVIPPTPGTSHPTGNPWTLLTGTPNSIPTLTLEQRDQIHAILATVLDEPDTTPTQAPISLTSRAAAREDGSHTPGDDYENATSWAEILTPHGWQIHHQTGNETHWTRPGKNPRDGVSATTGHADDRDRLYVFSSSTDFEPEVPYTKLGALAVLEFGGDHSAAVRHLARTGYGDPLPPKSTVFDITPTSPTPPAPAAYGTLALHSAPADEPTEFQALEARTLNHTDDWAALQLIAEHGTTIRYVPDRGRWLHWIGHTWQIQPSTGGHIRELTKHVARALPEDSRDETTFKKRFLSATGTTNTLTQAQTDPRITVDWDDLDNHPYELNTPGGIVNLRTGQLGPSDPTRLHTRTTTITPNWDTPHDLWDTFLATTFDGQDNQLADYLQRLLGYSITGAVTHHVLPFLHGAGANGKSTMLDVVMALLGSYAGSTPAGFLMQGMQQHETEIARLSGLRFVVASEVNERDRFDEAKVKQLTGGDTLTARFMRQDHFTFTPTHHLWLMGNKQPRVQTGGESFWRRLRMIPFANVVPRTDRDEHLTQKLIDEEGPAILAWIIDGAKDATAAGIRDPESVLAATREYASEEDALGQYVEERLRTGTSGHEKAATVRADYEDWCHRNGEQPMSAQVLSRELRTRFGVKLTKSNGVRQYDGVMLYADPDAEPSPDHWSDR